MNRKIKKLMKKYAMLTGKSSFRCYWWAVEELRRRGEMEKINAES